MTTPLRFVVRRSYYQTTTHEFNLPAGYSCPWARDCLLKADRRSGKMVKGPHNVFRCYAAVAERFPAVRANRWHNFDALRKCKTAAELTQLLLISLPANATRVRIHGSGDFYNQNYFDAWLAVARARPHVLFWSFTKSVQLWINRLSDIPANLILQASRGGLQDQLIDAYRLKSATVFPTLAAAQASGLPIDTDDTYASSNQGSFALVDNYGPDSRQRKPT